DAPDFLAPYLRIQFGNDRVWACRQFSPSAAKRGIGDGKDESFEHQE
ncbi:MAG: hypothetical protein ACI85K_003435, partial [Hyphomicrobiaceae bacterium]